MRDSRRDLELTRELFLMVYNQVAREKLHLVELQLFQVRLMSQEVR
jgi:hypothetical protein